MNEEGYFKRRNAGEEITVCSIGYKVGIKRASSSYYYPVICLCFINENGNYDYILKEKIINFDVEKFELNRIYSIKKIDDKKSTFEIKEKELIGDNRFIKYDFDKIIKENEINTNWEKVQEIYLKHDIETKRNSKIAIILSIILMVILLGTVIMIKVFFSWEVLAIAMFILLILFVSIICCLMFPHDNLVGKLEKL